MVANVLDSLIKVAAHEKQRLQLYVEAFETPFLQATVQFYEREAQQCLSTTDCASYLVMAQQRLEQEEERATRVLHATTRGKLKETCVKVLVEANREAIEAECKVG